MIISRTPYRISFFGGGTDYPEWFNEYGGAAIGCTIDKHCYITYRKLPPFFEHRNRIVYSAVEHTQRVDHIKHSGIRECLKYMMRESVTHCGLEIHHDGDLPARSGTGSSSAFVVGMLNILHTLQFGGASADLLARDSIFVERQLIKDAGGWQDQVLIATGGFNQLSFSDNSFQILPLLGGDRHMDSRVRELVSRTMLVFTGSTRDASAISESYNAKRVDKLAETHRTLQLVYEATRILRGQGDLSELGALMHESWELKKARGSGVSSPEVDVLYNEARRLGCQGGKLIGAGGAGFMLLLVDPDEKERIRTSLVRLGYIDIPFRLDEQGPQILYNNE